ncbi:MAG: hypothetical protein WCV73_04400 [Patescibacteria group bacterium]|jgi:hypothetical protein
MMLRWFKDLPRSERRFFIICAIVVLFLSTLPVLTGFMLAHGQIYTDRVYLGGADKMVYLSQIEEVSQGHWLLHNLYTAERQIPYLSPLWLVLGLLAGLFKLAPLLVFHLVRILFGAIFLFLVYYLLLKIFTESFWRKTSFLIVGLSSGLGVFTVFRPWTDANMVRYFGSDIWFSEGNSFLTLAHSPLFILSQIILLVIFGWLINRLSKAGWLESALMGLLIFFLGIIHPYDLVIVGAVGGVWWLVKIILAKRFLWREFFKLLILLINALLAVGYFFYLINSSPAFGGWFDQNITLSPGLINYLIGYGLLVPFFILGVKPALKSGNKYLYFLTVWGAVAWFLLFLPLPSQRRFGNGMHIPMAIIAVYGTYWVWQSIKNSRVIIYLQKIFVWQTILQIIFFVLISSSLFSVGAKLAMQSYYQKNIYLQPSEANALLWLKNNIDKNSVILSEHLVGNFIPAFTGRFVYLGHGHQTNRWSEKMVKVEQWFFATNNDDAQKSSWLMAEGIDYVYFGLNEKTLGSFDPFVKPYLSLVWQQGEVAIFKVK